MPISILLGVMSCESWQKNCGKYTLRGFKIIQSHRICHQSKGHMQLPLSG